MNSYYDLNRFLIKSIIQKYLVIAIFSTSMTDLSKSWRDLKIAKHVLELAKRSV